MANFDIDKKQLQDEVVLDDNQLVCVLTNSIKTATEKELLLQSIINQMDEEYEFNLSDMKRDYSFSYEDDEGKKKRMTIDLAIFRHEAEKEPENIERICIVFDSKAKESDKKKGVEATLHKALQATGCDFGMWTNGDKQFFAYRKEDEIGNERIEDISDFPGCDETIEDLENMGDRAQPRKAANDTLIRTFKRCHDYLYGNEGRKKDAFWELLNLIFCKIFDEKRRFTDAEKGFSYRRQFWVGVTEQNTPEGQATVAKRIKDIFERLKKDDLFKTVFDGNEQISLSDRGVAYVASQIAKYSFLDATVDVKGTAYETIVSNTLKQEAGQFFTPRNIIKCMVEIMNPNQHCRVLDPACGSGGFLVMVLDHVRRQITRNIYADRSEAEIDALSNTDETVNKIVRQYAESMIFGFDFDPDLKKAAKMNMVMAGDGHSNIFNINSLEYPFGSLPDLERINEAVSTSVGHRGDYATCDEHAAKDSAFGKFDMIFTNPPFGSKVEVAQGIVEHYDLSAWIKSPEGLFIEQCYNFLKPGGKMAIVLPDGILSNPNTEKVREWILSKFKLIASIDLPVEAFLPQVGVQASLLFLQKKIGIELGQKEDYEVFMAIAEKVGKDRRGNPIYKRDDNGAEILYPTKKEWAARNRHGELITRSRVERVRRLDDDLPEISEEYKKIMGI